MKKNNSKSRSELIATVLAYAFLIALAVVIIFPFISALCASFKTNQEILVSPKLIPEKWQIKNYIDAWNKANFATYTWNSVWYSALSVIIAIFTSTVGGYVFSRGEFRGKNVIFAVFTSLMFITLGTSSMYPQIQILKLLHLNTSLAGLLVMQFFGINITNVFLVRGFVNSLPKSLDEAAEIDGCSFIKIFFIIILPLLKPIIATVGIFAFSAAWNDYLMPMVVTLANPAQRPLSVGMIALKGSSDAATAWNLILAGGMISAIPMIIVFLMFNKYFIKGLTAGAVKG